MSSEDGILSVSEARKRLGQIRQLTKSNKPTNAGVKSSQDAMKLADRLVREISDTVSKHGDVRTRVLMAVYAEISRLAG